MNMNKSDNSMVSTLIFTSIAAVSLYLTKQRSSLQKKQDEKLLKPKKSSATSLCPLVICGPSGVGKGTLIDRLMAHFNTAECFGFSVSHTTRKPRPGEKDGVHYNFSDVETMKQEIDAGKFIEYAEVHGNYYGTSFEAVQSVQNSGKVCILDIDIQGVQIVKQNSTSFDANYLFIAPPSMEALESRLRGRGTEKEEDIQRRLKQASNELDYGREPGNFDRILVNEDLEKAFKEFVQQIESWYPHLKK